MLRSSLVIVSLLLLALPAYADADGRQGVSMQCQTRDGGHRVTIFATNTNASNRDCSSICYHRNDLGGDGQTDCKGSLGANDSDVVFCETYDANRTFTVTDPGGFDCTR